MSDLVSRQAAIEAICKVCGVEKVFHKCTGYPERCDEIVALRALPSAQPERRTGRWIKHNESIQLLYGVSKGGVKCSKCGYMTHNKMHVLVGCPWKYCPNCGAKMEVSNE